MSAKILWAGHVKRNFFSFNVVACRVLWQYGCQLIRVDWIASRFSFLNVPQGQRWMNSHIGALQLEAVTRSGLRCVKLVVKEEIGGGEQYSFREL